MASPSLTTMPEPAPAMHSLSPPGKLGRLMVVGIEDPAAIDYANYARQKGESEVTVVDRLPTVGELGHVATAVIFVGSGSDDRKRHILRQVLAGLPEASVIIVSRFKPDSTTNVLNELKAHQSSVRLFETGAILSPRSRISAKLRRWGACYPLVPRRLKGCCVDASELFAAIENERKNLSLSHGVARRHRRYILSGPNRPWRERLAENAPNHFVANFVKIVCSVFSWTGIGVLGSIAFNHWNFDALRPKSFRELLALYNPYNFRHVKIVGYNNGVNHFGHRYPGKTIVSTVNLNRLVRRGGDTIKSDCGATIRSARDFIAPAGQDLFVIPNYSYVALGTSFFVPIHGSATQFSCVSDTISKVMLYDPKLDRLVVATREEPAFREAVYNQESDALLLRLYVRVKPQERYYVHEEEQENPTGVELAEALQDKAAANVEIRKSNAAGSAIRLFKYYNDNHATKSAVLEVPRDALGRLWDRLEENWLTSFLMHALTRHLAWHIELFLTPNQFVRFWDDHRSLPLKKIQLRFIHRDDLPHSPFRDSDCISSDMFTFRWNRAAVENYLKQTFDSIRVNPGKHSM